MAIPAHIKENFQGLKEASDAGQMCITECFDTRTNQKVYVICATFKHENEEIELIPVAQMYETDPHNFLRPPDPDSSDGFKPLETDENAN